MHENTHRYEIVAGLPNNYRNLQELVTVSDTERCLQQLECGMKTPVI